MIWSDNEEEAGNLELTLLIIAKLFYLLFLFIVVIMPLPIWILAREINRKINDIDN